MARAYGLPADAALRAITLSPAEIFGVADRLGSIRSGKYGNLVVASGDIMDHRTQVDARLHRRRRPVARDTAHAALPGVQGPALTAFVSERRRRSPGTPLRATGSGIRILSAPKSKTP